MGQKSLFVTLFLLSSSLFAAHQVELHKAPVSSLKQFSLESPSATAARSLSATSIPENTLREMSKITTNNGAVIRYQQFYKGLPVVGAQVMLSNNSNTGEVNGILLNDINLNSTPTLSAQRAIDLAKASYLSRYPVTNIEAIRTELQIRSGQDNELKLVYLVSFKSVSSDGKPVWPFMVIDAEDGNLLKQWNNIKTYHDSGPGGNEKTREYWYGKDGLPWLDVTQKGNQCIMDNGIVKLVNLKKQWDWKNTIQTPYQYSCNNNTEDYINGAFSPINDGYYFGNIIVSMYRDWYQLNALQNPDGTAMKLIMKVHFGQHFENAFWDGESMTFGDGELYFYPLVSLDIAGHEVTHGFTEQHSGLEYHDQSGALNESFSDMAGQASRAFLLEKSPQLYNKAYLNSNQITWGIGETVTQDFFGKALRFMDVPSSDGHSAECLDKNLAQSSGASCAISYNELISELETQFPDNPEIQQDFIVHFASGVFNKAFYLLSQELGMKQAFQLMIIANTKYWTPTTDFKNGACGVLYAAKDTAIDIRLVQSVFNQVGVDTLGCML